ncbi:Arylsulfatase [Novipirellula aureliae]|uniref:Arylsulfatase n=1 Tax=Novipirellula aureliae TaxID=2527966 RepID=A0A5C6DSV6_9BACT|nr:sulfatase-like hydrolase/transferase [Novipirellula aureliae]TWU39017.1 Arylsulfatase [Novipirellula aureliae]
MNNCVLIMAVVATMAVGGTEAVAQPNRISPPNILVFLADDLGYGDLGCYGNPIIKTPHMDQLASEGVRLTDCHAGGTVCSPSRSALLTGRNPYRSGFFYIQGRDTHLRDNELTIAEILQSKGYETSFWGKWHLSALEKNSRDEPGPGDQGFDYWMGTTLNAFDGPKDAGKFYRNGEPVGKVDGWYCDVIVDQASDWLKNKRDKDKPFFMYLCSHEPHTPISPPREYSDLYDTPNTERLEKQTQYGDVERPKRDISQYKKEYYGTVNQLDDALGRLMQTLDSLGLKENTLVILTSDNGPETPVTLEESLGQWEDPIRDKCFGTPGDLKGMKRYPYEGGHRVPGIARWPGVIPAGLISDSLFNGTDFLPTFCKLAGAPVPSDRPIDGIDAFNAFLNKKVDRNVPSIWFYPHHGDTYFRMPQIAMRNKNYTLIGWLPRKDEGLGLKTWFVSSDPDRFELYDMIDDPQQEHDLAAEKPEIVAAMKKDMIALWREMRAEGMALKSE